MATAIYFHITAESCRQVTAKEYENLLKIAGNTHRSKQLPNHDIYYVAPYEMHSDDVRSRLSAALNALLQSGDIG